MDRSATMTRDERVRELTGATAHFCVLRRELHLLVDELDLLVRSATVSPAARATKVQSYRHRIAQLRSTMSVMLADADLRHDLDELAALTGRHRRTH